MGDNRKLYDNLLKSGKISEGDIGDFTTFDSLLKTPDKANVLYKNLRKGDLFTEEEIGDSVTFMSLIEKPVPKVETPETDTEAQSEYQLSFDKKPTLEDWVNKPEKTPQQITAEKTGVSEQFVNVVEETAKKAVPKAEKRFFKYQRNNIYGGFKSTFPEYSKEIDEIVNMMDSRNPELQMQAADRFNQINQSVTLDPRYPRYKNEFVNPTDVTTATKSIIDDTNGIKNIAEKLQNQIVPERISTELRIGLENYIKGYTELGKRLDQSQQIRDLVSKLKEVEKGNDVKLSEEEGILLQALDENIRTHEDIKSKLPKSYDWATSAGYSLGFMAEFILGRGIVSKVAKPVKAILTAGKIGGAASPLSLGMLKLIEAGVQPALMPSFYRMIAENRAEGKSLGRSFGEAWDENFKEVISEYMFMSPSDKIAKGFLNKFFKLAGVTLNTESGVKGFIKNMAEEYIEEKVAEIYSAPKDYKNFQSFWNQFINKQDNINTFASVAFIIGAMSAPIVAMKSYDKIRSDIVLNGLQKKLPKEISGDIDIILKDKTLTNQEIFKLLGDVIDNRIKDGTIISDPTIIASDAIRYTVENLKKITRENVDKSKPEEIFDKEIRLPEPVETKKTEPEKIETPEIKEEKEIETEGEYFYNDVSIDETEAIQRIDESESLEELNKVNIPAESPLQNQMKAKETQILNTYELNLKRIADLEEAGSDQKRINEIEKEYQKSLKEINAKYSESVQKKSTVKEESEEILAEKKTEISESQKVEDEQVIESEQKIETVKEKEEEIVAEKEAEKPVSPAPVEQKKPEKPKPKEKEEKVKPKPSSQQDVLDAIEKQRQADPDFDNKKINDFLIEVRQYNRLTPAKKNRFNIASLNNRASLYGLSIKYTGDTHRTIVLLDSKGKEIKNPRKLKEQKERIEKGKGLSDYPTEIINFANKFFKLSDNIKRVVKLYNPMTIVTINSAIRDIKAGKKSKAANELLESINHFFDVGEIEFKARFGEQVSTFTLDEFDEIWFESELSKEQKEQAEQLPNDIVDAVLSDQILSDEQFKELYEINPDWASGYVLLENEIADEKEQNEKEGIAKVDQQGEENVGSKEVAERGKSVKEESGEKPDVVKDRFDKEFDDNLEELRNKLQKVNKQIEDKRKELEKRAKKAQKEIFPKPGLQEGEIETPLDLRKQNVDKILNPLLTEKYKLEKDIDDALSNKDDIIKKRREEQEKIDKAQGSLFQISRPKKKVNFRGFLNKLGLTGKVEGLDKSARVGKINSVNVIIQQGDNESEAIIESIRTPKILRGRGKAQKALTKIINEADKDGITLKLRAVPEEGAKITQQQLIDWYKNNGFVFAEGSNRGVRSPNVKMQAEGQTMVRAPKKIFDAILERLFGTKLAKAVITDKAKIEEKLKQYGIKKLQDLKRQATAWHGTPYDFEKFSTEKIGTGEGAQAFGWGMYFTELEDIARYYAKSLSKKSLPKWADYASMTDREMLRSNNITTDKLNRLKARVRYRIEQYYNQYNNGVFDNGEEIIKKDIDEAKYLKSLIDELDKETISSLRNKRVVYKVTLHKGKEPGEYNWLEWDKPINDLIKSKLNNIGIPVEHLGKIRYGKDIYEGLAGQIGQKEASLKLLNAGIDGIKYPAESLSGKPARGYNYVVFDENAITIEEKLKFMATTSGEVYGFTTPEGEIYIDLDKININTPIHEYGHLWIGWAKNNAPELFEKGLRLADDKNSPYFKDIWDNPAYGNLREQYEAGNKTDFLEEVLATAIGDKGEQFVNSKRKTDFKQWLLDLFNAIKKALGISQYTAKQLQDITFDEFTQAVAIELLKGEEIAKKGGTQNAKEIRTSTEKTGTEKGIEGREGGRLRVRDNEKDRLETKTGETIIVDGVERPTRNSNGQLIHSTRKGIENFWKWFGNSKVVDEQGRPLVVYHGTNAIFSEFNKMYFGGYYFTDNSIVAEEYFTLEYGSNIIPVYLKINNPTSFDFNGKDIGNPTEIIEVIEAQNELHGKNYDGGIYKNVKDGISSETPISNVYVVFDSSQIKSATGNTGEFSSTTGDIRFAAKPNPKLTVKQRLEEIKKRGSITTKEKADIWGRVRNAFNNVDKLRKRVKDTKKGFAELSDQITDMMKEMLTAKERKFIYPGQYTAIINRLGKATTVKAKNKLIDYVRDTVILGNGAKYKAALSDARKGMDAIIKANKKDKSKFSDVKAAEEVINIDLTQLSLEELKDFTKLTKRLFRSPRTPSTEYLHIINDLFGAKQKQVREKTQRIKDIEELQQYVDDTALIEITDVESYIMFNRRLNLARRQAVDIFGQLADTPDNTTAKEAIEAKIGDIEKRGEEIGGEFQEQLENFRLAYADFLSSKLTSQETKDGIDGLERKEARFAGMVLFHTPISAIRKLNIAEMLDLNIAIDNLRISELAPYTFHDLIVKLNAINKTDKFLIPALSNINKTARWKRLLDRGLKSSWIARKHPFGNAENESDQLLFELMKLQSFRMDLFLGNTSLTKKFGRIFSQVGQAVNEANEIKSQTEQQLYDAYQIFAKNKRKNKFWKFQYAPDEQLGWRKIIGMWMIERRWQSSEYFNEEKLTKDNASYLNVIFNTEKELHRKHATDSKSFDEDEKIYNLFLKLARENDAFKKIGDIEVLDIDKLENVLRSDPGIDALIRTIDKIYEDYKGMHEMATLFNGRGVKFGDKYFSFQSKDKRMQIDDGNILNELLKVDSGARLQTGSTYQWTGAKMYIETDVIPVINSYTEGIRRNYFIYPLLRENIKAIRMAADKIADDNIKQSNNDNRMSMLGNVIAKSLLERTAMYFKTGKYHKEKKMFDILEKGAKKAMLAKPAKTVTETTANVIRMAIVMERLPMSIYARIKENKDFYQTFVSEYIGDKYFSRWADEVNETIYKNKWAEYAEVAADWFITFADKTVGKAMFVGYFTDTFKSITGKEFSEKEYQDDPSYRFRYAEAIDDATTTALSRVEELFNNKNPLSNAQYLSFFNGLINMRADSGMARVFNFLMSFGRNEANQIVDSVRRYRWSGQGSKERIMAKRDILGVVTSNFMYGILRKMMSITEGIIIAQVSGIFGKGGGDDDKYIDEQKQQLKSGKFYWDYATKRIALDLILAGSANIYESAATFFLFFLESTYSIDKGTLERFYELYNTRYMDRVPLYGMADRVLISATPSGIQPMVKDFFSTGRSLFDIVDSLWDLHEEGLLSEKDVYDLVNIWNMGMKYLLFAPSVPIVERKVNQNMYRLRKEHIKQEKQWMKEKEKGTENQPVSVIKM